jgi:hypothetical protein
VTTQLPLDLDRTPPSSPATISAFHVRSEMSLPEALAGERRARTQEVVILDWFRGQPPGTRLAPSDVHKAFDRWPITSVRRSLHGLTKKGQLVHYPTNRHEGPWGSMESTWGLA